LDRLTSPEAVGTRGLRYQRQCANGERICRPGFGELLTRKGLNVNASRLLFEGLEDRILLSGIPAALIASLPHFTETHSGSISKVVGGVATEPFYLQKFDDQGGLRILVEATIESTTTTTTGTRMAENQSNFAGIVNVLILTLSAESNVFVAASTPIFPWSINLTASLQDDPNYATLKNIGAKDILDWLPTIKAGQTYPDLRSVTLAAQTWDPQPQTLLYPDGGLNDFISSPGDSTILFEITTASSVSLDAPGIVARTRTSPLIEYTMTGEVTYVYVMLGTSEDYYQGSKYDFRKPAAAQFQPFYSGTAQPGSTLAVDVLGLGGEVLGSTSTIVDAGGNWAASFYDLGMTGEPHTVSIRQSYAGYTPLTGAGYNLRRYFSPAILGGAYASEHLTVENVLGKRAADVSMAAIYSASANPIMLDPTLYAYEMLPMSACPQGLH